MQTTQVRVRINQDNSDYLRKLADRTGLQQVDIATMLLHAALVALREAGESAPFPIQFKVRQDKDAANETPKTKSRQSL